MKNLKVHAIYTDGKDSYTFDGNHYFIRKSFRGKWNKIPEEHLPNNLTQIMDGDFRVVAEKRALRHLPRYANRPGLDWEIEFLRSITYIEKAYEEVIVGRTPFKVERGCFLTVDEDGQIFEFNSRPFYVKELKRWVCEKASHITKHVGNADKYAEAPQLAYAPKPYSVRNTMPQMDIAVAKVLLGLENGHSFEISGMSEFVIKDLMKRLGLVAEFGHKSKFRFKIERVSRL